MSEAAQVDHLVINVGYEMAAAAPLFEQLGFTLTPQGRHSFGSINHLMMFGTDYLELIGLPADRSVERPDISGAPTGINGLVFKSNNVDETFVHLGDAMLAGDPPKAFTRPVQLDSGEAADASFRTVAVAPSKFPAGRLYFCEHHTPEYVWRPEWQSHANSVTHMQELVIVAEAPADPANALANAIASVAEKTAENSFSVQSAKDFVVTCVTPAAYKARFGTVATPTEGRPVMMGAIVFAGGDASVVERRASGDAFTTVRNGSGLCVRVNSFDSLLVFA